MFPFRKMKKILILRNRTHEIKENRGNQRKISPIFLPARRTYVIVKL